MSSSIACPSRPSRGIRKSAVSCPSGVNFPDLWRRSASFVDKVLKGAKPADLPVEPPTKFEMLVNLKTAKALGLTMPPALLIRADQVIQ